MNGISSGLCVIGKGKVDWKTYDNSDQEVIIAVKAYYVPHITIRLLSPQQLASPHHRSFEVGMRDSLLKWKTDKNQVL